MEWLDYGWVLRKVTHVLVLMKATRNLLIRMTLSNLYFHLRYSTLKLCIGNVTPTNLSLFLIMHTTVCCDKPDLEIVR